MSSILPSSIVGNHEAKSNWVKSNRIAAVLASSLLIAGCSNGQNDYRAKVSNTLVFEGAIASPEAAATMIGRSILAQGGNAIDAATATALALSVTMPAAAGLAGGGQCMVVQATEASEFFDFRASPGASQGQVQQRPAVTVPMLARGLSALHARYGTLPWPVVIAPGERMARFGFRLSTASADHWNQILAQTDDKRLHGFVGGLVLHSYDGAGHDGAGMFTPGMVLHNPALASQLGQIRAHGGNFFIRSAAIRFLVQSYLDAGLMLNSDMVRTSLPDRRPASTTAFGDDLVHVPDDSPGSEAMIEAARFLGQQGTSWDKVLFDPVWQRKWLASLPQSMATAIRHDGVNLAAIDSNGLGVICWLTNGRPPWVAVPNLGFIAGQAGQNAEQANAIMIALTNQNSGKSLWLAGGRGSVIDRLVLAGMLEGASRRVSGLHSRMAVKRRFINPLGEGLAFDEQADPRLRLGDITSIWCLNGVPFNAITALCQSDVDPRSQGLALSFEKPI
ncbi:MAG: gamma-glutamyltransferase [Pseudomonadota bacterium]